MVVSPTIRISDGGRRTGFQEPRIRGRVSARELFPFDANQERALYLKDVRQRKRAHWLPDGSGSKLLGKMRIESNGSVNLGLTSTFALATLASTNVLLVKP